MDIRRHRVRWGAGSPRSRTSETYWQQPLRWNRDAHLFSQCESCGRRGNCSDAVSCEACGGYAPQVRRRVFCASLADVFDNEVDQAWRDDLFALIQDTPNLDWLLLTKRIGNVAWMVSSSGVLGRVGLPPNVWLGATVVNQAEADRDIPKLLDAPAHMRFLSCEPLLGPIELTRVKIGEECGVDWSKDAPEDLKGVRTLQFVVNALAGAPKSGIPGLNWVIAGGESGPGARPMNPAWALSLRDQCAAANVPFFFKQWGEYLPGETDFDGERHTWEPHSEHRPPGLEYERVRVLEAHGIEFGQLGKARAGRTLDDATHSEFPRAAA
jgi:protein gp37